MLRSSLRVEFIERKAGHTLEVLGVAGYKGEAVVNCSGGLVEMLGLS